MSLTAIATQLNVSLSSISRIMHGKAWSELTGIHPTTADDPHPDEAQVWEHWHWQPPAASSPGLAAMERLPE
jgi:hypothetical protein